MFLSGCMYLSRNLGVRICSSCAVSRRTAFCQSCSGHVVYYINRLALYRTKGMGINAIGRNPKVELAQATRRLLYMAVAKRGNPAPKPARIRSRIGVPRVSIMNTASYGGMR